MHKEIKKLNHFHYTNAGAYTTDNIPAPGAGKRILIYGGVAMGSDAIFLVDGTDKILDIPSNSSIILPAPLACAENKSLDAQTEDVIIFYQIEDCSVAGGAY
tara:strand:+ start:106 stop:411 length:306 start_codon:yes stop_codon:yes gene_type:complete